MGVAMFLFMGLSFSAGVLVLFDMPYPITTPFEMFAQVIAGTLLLLIGTMILAEFMSGIYL